MKVLLVKTSSLGDVIHALPAVSDALTSVPGLSLDWVVEEAFADIPRRHPGVSNVIPCAVRRWRRQWWASRGEILQLRQRLQNNHYDLVLDSQGLLKSALIARLAGASVTAGYQRDSAREPLAALFYRRTSEVPLDLHAVTRQRRLFADLLGYDCPDTPVNFGLTTGDQSPDSAVLCFHGTTWATKHWPVHCWKTLGRLLAGAGLAMRLPAGNSEERQRAETIAAAVGDTASVLPPMSLDALCTELTRVQGVVTVDTGLGHLAGALNLPLVAIYGPTRPALTGPLSQYQTIFADTNLPCAPCMNKHCRYDEDTQERRIFPPCFETSSPEQVLEALQQQIEVARSAN
ncbi:MAG: lipopolysaccharide heptosyltransferase I [Pseudomonadales bacterium]|nr:lipopolysaccharide heptosyltransferase I [Pseudomonadales bacterium]